MDALHKFSARREQAAALILVLAFVVLVTGLVIAYLSRATSDRPVAHASFNQTKADQLAASAADNIIGDLRQEVVNGSSPSPTPTPPYVPMNSANLLPMYNPTPTPGTTPAIPNLIRRSVRSESAKWPDPNLGPALGSRASAVNSFTDASANGRSISLARWNSHYLIPKSNPIDDKSDPITTGFTAPNFWAPDWVFVTNTGSTVITQPSTSVIGRYAYAIYDEAGLLDLNAAGYPSNTTIFQAGRKGSLAFADLNGTGTPNLSTIGIDNTVGWRNYASSQPSGTLTTNMSFDAAAATRYYNFILSDPNYIKLTTYFTNYFLTTSGAPVYNNQSDQAFISRQELINFRGSTTGGIFTSNALQYLSTFSREAMASSPQWKPTVPDATNPNFQTLWVTGPFTRNDGTTALAGEYLVNKRFFLQRLNWLTYRGPSAIRTIPSNAPAIGAADYDMWLLTRSNGLTFGLTSDFLSKGTDLSQAGQTGSTANIYKYFGLVWDAANERWNYIGHPSTPSAGSPLASSISTIGTLTASREPDFFELLQAGIINNSLGDAFSPDPALPVIHQQSRMLHILTIGANLIAQSRMDSYPVRIACNVNVAGTLTPMEAVGMPRLPCINSLAACPVAGTTTAGGGVNWFLIPNLWNPYRDTWDLTEANTGNNGNGPLLTPGYLRPPVRITVSGSAGFGAVVSSQSGSVDPASVTSFSTTLTISPSPSLTLATGNNTSGRDGLREASRLGTSDLTAAPATYVVTTSPTSAGFSWNSISRPPRPPDPLPGTDNFVVFRLSIPGSGILSTFNGKNPVLILKPAFQMTMDYQSPNGTWYPYSFLQGNNASSTWISANLNLTTSFSQYGLNTSPVSTSPTVLHSSVGTIWDVTTLAQAPMFAKGDPRSMRYNSQIGVVNLSKPPMAVVSAGVLGSLWPNTYATPPLMSPSGYPIPTPTPNPNPAIYSQLGDNGPAASNPYNESTGDSVRPIIMNRPFRSVGEMGYAFRDQPFRTLSFSSVSSPDAGLLDLFSVKDYSVPAPSPTPTPTPTPFPTATPRGGVVSLSSRQAPAIAAILKTTIVREDTPRIFSGGAASPAPSPMAATQADSVAKSLVSLTLPAPFANRADLSNMIANETGFGPTVPKTQRESIARALGEVDQTRTWNLMIDVIAQSGRYPSSETDLKKFVVEGEQRYWVHVAIDRFTGEVIDRQIEPVKE
jgi:hypothetical protein